MVKYVPEALAFAECIPQEYGFLLGKQVPCLANSEALCYVGQVFYNLGYTAAPDTVMG